MISENFYKYLQPDVHFTFDDNPLEFLRRKGAHVTENHIDKALDGNFTLRMAGILHSNATNNNVAKALKDSSWAVRKAAIQSPNVTKEQLEHHAVNDDSEWVRREALYHLNKR